MDYPQVTSLMEGFLEPTNYGFGELLGQPISRFPSGLHIIRGLHRGTPDAYDCLDAAILTKERLQQGGIASKICEGVEDLGIMRAHFYNELEDGTAVDLTPPHKLIGAKHKKVRILPQETIDVNMNADAILIGQGPLILGYRDEGNGRTYLSTLGSIGHISKLDELMALELGKPVKIYVGCETYEFVEGIPQHGFGISFIVDKAGLIKKFGFDRLEHYSREKSEDLFQPGLVIPKESAFSLSYDEHGELVTTDIEKMSVRDLYEIAVSNLDVVRSYLINSIGVQDEE